MRKTIPLICVLTALCLSSSAQILSEFTWDSNPVTQAVIGPNGTSVNAAASSVAGGFAGTNGLDPGTGSNNINLVVPGATLEDSGLDVSIYFRKEENDASFFTLGSLDFGITTGAIYVNYLLKTSSGDSLVQKNNAAAVPGDGAWHQYRFVYNYSTGTATVSVDGAVEYTYNTKPGTPLSWTGATNATIGLNMDGSNANVAELDSLVIQKPPYILPVQLISFHAQNAGAYNDLSWAADREVNFKSYVVERSADGLTFQPIGTRMAQESYSSEQDYTYTDSLPTPSSYYRLKMVNTDGTFVYSGICEVNSAAPPVAISCYPNPVINSVTIKVGASKTVAYHYSLIATDGRILQTGIMEAGGDQQTSLNLTRAPKGILFLRVQAEDSGAAQTFTLLRE
jgi:hypothetical protein